MTIRAPAPFWADVKARAAAEGLSVEALVRFALLKYMNPTLNPEAPFETGHD